MSLPWPPLWRLEGRTSMRPRRLLPLVAAVLVLTHFVANQQPVLMVLKNFSVVARFDGLEFPSTIRSADFNGDGRVDIWESTDEVERLRTFTNTPDGTLVPGAIDMCSRD